MFASSCLCLASPIKQGNRVSWAEGGARLTVKAWIYPWICPALFISADNHYFTTINIFPVTHCSNSYHVMVFDMIDPRVGIPVIRHCYNILNVMHLLLMFYTTPTLSSNYHGQVYMYHTGPCMPWGRIRSKQR